MWRRIDTTDRVLFLATMALAELSYVLPHDSYLKLVTAWSACIVGYGLFAAYRLDPLRAVVVPTAGLLVVGRVNGYEGLDICAMAWTILAACSVLLVLLRACAWLVGWLHSRPQRVRRTGEAGLVASAVRGRADQVRAEDVLAEMGFGPR